MSIVKTRYYNVIWYVPEDETEADVAQETRILLPRSGMSENGAYINMRMMDEGDLMVNREPPETSTNFIMTLTTNLTKIFNGEKEVLKSMIKSVTINEKKKITTVVFTDGDVQMAKCSKNDEYDKTVGISICIAAHLAGSKEKLKKFVKEITEK